MKIFFLLIPIFVFGQDVTINEISVLANKYEPVNHLDMKEIENSIDPPALFNLQSSSITFSSDNGTPYGYTYFRLRGIDQTRINFTLDGIPLNEPEDQGVYFSNYVNFLGIVETAQLQKGVGLNSYGVSAYGGNIMFKSINPLATQPHFNAHTTLGSFNTSDIGLSTNYRYKKGGLFVRGSYLHTDGYRDNSATEGVSFGAIWEHQLKNDLNIRFLTIGGRIRNQMAYLGSTEDFVKINRRHNFLTPEEDDLFFQNMNVLSFTRQHSPFKSWDVSLFYTRLNGNYDVLFDSAMNNFRLNSHFGGAVVTFKNKLKDFLTFKHGINLSAYKRTHALFLDSEVYNNFGLKTEGSYFINSNWYFGKIVILANLQGRAVNFLYTPDNDYSLERANQTWVFVNPKIGITYNTNQSNRLYYYLGYSEREPTRTDMFAGFDDVDTTNVNLIYPLDKVKPESVIDNELGYGFAKEKIKINTNVFVCLFKNEIAPIGELSYIGLPLRKNVGETYRYGWETNVRFEYKSFLITGDLTLMKGIIKHYETEYDGKTYSNTTPFLTPMTNFVGSITYKKNKFRIGIENKCVGQQYLDNIENLKLSRYYFLNLRGAYVIGNYLTLHASINNITNNKYYTSGHSIVDVPYYFVAPTINFNVGFTVNVF